MSGELALLMLLAFAAGFVDSIVGGGGLIQLPALFVLMPQLPAAVLLGTNKFAAVWGTGVAAWQYASRLPVAWQATVPTLLAALLFGYLGARSTALMDETLFRPLVFALLLGLLAYTLWKKDLGALHAPRLGPWATRITALACGSGIGFYDGFFGPGTGSFLLFAFVGLFGYSFLAASASAKLVNLGTNLAALGFFIAADLVRYELAVPMAVCNVAGSVLGARLALRRGSGFVRRLFIIVVAALIARFAWDLWRG